MKKLLSVICFFVLVNIKSNAQNIFEINEDFVSSPLVGYLYVFTDTSNKISNSQLDFSRFKLYQQESLNFGTNGQRNWIMLNCRNNSNVAKDIVVDMDIVYLDSFDYYIYAGDSLIRKREGINWQTSLSERDIDSRYFAFPITLSPHTQYKILISVRETNGYLYCPLTLFTQREFQRQYIEFDTIFFSAVSVLAVIALISLFFLMAYPQWIILYYFIYILGNIGYALNIEGYMAHYAPNFLSTSRWYAISSLLIRIMSIFFALHFILPEHRSKLRGLTILYRAYLGVLFLFLFYISFFPFNHTIAETNAYASSWVQLVLLMIVIEGIIMKRRNSFIYLFSILPVQATNILLFLRITGIADIPEETLDNSSFYLFLYIAPVFEFIVLGIAILNDIIQERKTLTEELNMTQQKLLNVQEIERERIAQDLHDDLGGTLATINTQINLIHKDKTDNSTYSKIDTLKSMVAKASNDIRRIAHNLMPPGFEKIGLKNSLEYLVNNASGKNLKFEFISFGIERRLPDEVEINLYRITSELISNIHKHAMASRASVQLLYFQTHLSILVEDNGIGFKDRIEKNEGIGLKNVSLRAKYIGATLTIDTGQNGSTYILEIKIGAEEKK
ncbi:7TM-DISM domain-containing protein [Emticicia sp. BO119]|uniref:sensor histidine kinase n=1 Tax=Emticicia sp. BO119 TaxID=2757768 RepID=UPI0015F09F3E|nr:7TM-DISM domain-containing protein [Emticicia sp. BO119]MBA4850278.1 hypothetical protein [Emticicia sp. BO119]